MKMEFKASLLVIVTLTLCACGGSNKSNDTNSDITITSGTFRIQNISSTSNDLNNIQLLPENTLYIGISSVIRERNQDYLPQNSEERRYTAKIYLSDNTTVDDNDLQIAELLCEAGNNGFACNSAENIKCSYLTNGNNVITCNSVNYQGEQALINNVTSIGEYIDVLPKLTNIVVRSCLDLEPSKCFTNSKALTLY